MSNLLDQASIVLTPTAYDNGKVLCAKPIDGSGDFDFSRNSAATRVNSQGLVEDVQILSSNLVQNGDFSEQGAEEVSNGSFSQQGSELVTGGDFSNPSDWIKGTGWSISGGSLNASNVNGVSATQGGYTFLGKTFKVSYTISDYSQGSVQIYLGGNQSTSLKSENGTHTETISISSGNTVLYIYGISNFTGSIDNVSVVEVGQDWEFGVGWGLGEDKAVCSGHTSHTSLTQSNSFVGGKTYKISFDIIVDSGNFAIKLLGGGSDTGNTISSTQIGYTEYITPSANRTLFSIRSNDGNGIGSITNISVKEVDPNNYWTVINGIITDKYNASMTAYQSGIRITPFTKVGTFKVVFDLVVTSGSMKFDAGGGNDQIYSTSGTKEIIVTNTTKFEFNAFNLGWVGTLTNISVIEITDDTNLPRINYENFSYQDALGSELITNGDFSNGLANWVVDDGTSWTNVNDTAFCDGNNGLIRQDHTSTQSKVYKVTFDSVTNGGGLLGVRVASGAYAWNLYSTGTHTIYLTAGSSSTQGVMFYAINGWTGSIDNVSVKEYKGQEVVPASGCGSWLFEPQSTNLITYSEDFTQWNKSGSMVITPNNVISPDGTQNATLLTANSINQFIYLSSFSAANSTISLYIKRKSGTGDIELSNNGGSSYTVLSVTDEWSRVQLTFAAVTNQTVLKINTSGDEIYLWGVQVEQQSYATSYIPTDGTSVTRNQDVCANGGSVSTINSTEGVLYAEMSSLEATILSGYNYYITISDGTSGNRIELRQTSSNMQFLWRVGGVYQSQIVSSGILLTNFNKIALSYSNSKVVLWINGSQIGAINSPTLFPINTLNELSFTDGILGFPFKGKTKCLAVWKEALSDEELTLLTTI